MKTKGKMGLGILALGAALSCWIFTRHGHQKNDVIKIFLYETRRIDDSSFSLNKVYYHGFENPGVVSSHGMRELGKFRMISLDETLVKIINDTILVPKKPGRLKIVVDKGNEKDTGWASIDSNGFVPGIGIP